MTKCKNFSVDLVPILNERAGFPLGTELMLFEEIKPNTVDRIMNITDPLEKVWRNWKVFSFSN